MHTNITRERTVQLPVNVECPLKFIWQYYYLFVDGIITNNLRNFEILGTQKITVTLGTSHGVLISITGIIHSK